MKMKNEKKLNKKKELKKGNVDNKKIDKIKGNSELKNSVKIVFFVALIFGFFYLLTYVLVGDLSIFDKEDDKIETTIQYDEILAGSSFNMNASRYLVVYYDKSSDDADEVMSAIYTYEVSPEPLTVYTVDLSNALNHGVVTEDNSNKKPSKASELAIKGVTLIRFRDGEVREYIEGKDSVIDYLKK